MEERGSQIGSEVRVLDASQLLDVPEAMDPEHEKQVRADQAFLRSWLRSRGGQPWFDGIVMECLERFPRLDRFQVSAVIYALRDEDSALQKGSE